MLLRSRRGNWTRGRYSHCPAAVAPGGGERPPGLPRRLLRLPERLLRSSLEAFLSRFALPSYPAELVRPAHGVPKGLEHLPVVPVRTLYGCVMSYRRPLACAYRFN